MSSLIKQLMEPGIIPVFYHADPGYCQEVFASSVAAGITAFEFTNRGPNALENFQLLKAYRDQFAPKTLIGIGTILNKVDAEVFIEAGADFLVSPCLIEAVQTVCVAQGRLYIPGCMTIREIVEASSLGNTFIKIFPADALGISFVQAVKAVLPHMQLMVTGGIKPDPIEVQAWRTAGAAIVGIGSALFKVPTAVLDQRAFIAQKMQALLV